MVMVMVRNGEAIFQAVRQLFAQSCAGCIQARVQHGQIQIRRQQTRDRSGGGMLAWSTHHHTGYLTWQRQAVAARPRIAHQPSLQRHPALCCRPAVCCCCCCLLSCWLHEEKYGGRQPGLPQVLGQLSLAQSSAASKGLPAGPVSVFLEVPHRLEEAV